MDSKGVIKKIVKAILTWKEELFSIPLALLIYFFSPYALRWIDPTAGTYDAGIFQIIIFGTVSLLIYNGLAWMGVKQVFPEVFSYFQNTFKKDFQSLQSCQKIVISLCIWGFLLVSFIFLSRAL